MAVTIRSIAWQAPHALRVGPPALVFALVVDQHPADGGEADDDSNRDRPYADPDVAYDLPFGFILGDLAIPRLGLLVGVAHRLVPAQVPAVVDGRKLTSNVAGGSAAPWPLPPMPASRLRENAATDAHRAAPAAAMKTDPGLHFAISSAPPTSGPTIEPTRPIPSAQPTPVALTEVG